MLDGLNWSHMSDDLSHPIFGGVPTGSSKVMPLGAMAFQASRYPCLSWSFHFEHCSATKLVIASSDGWVRGFLSSWRYNGLIDECPVGAADGQVERRHHPRRSRTHVRDRVDRGHGRADHEQAHHVLVGREV